MTQQNTITALDQNGSVVCTCICRSMKIDGLLPWERQNEYDMLNADRNPDCRVCFKLQYSRGSTSAPCTVQHGKP